MTPPPVLNDSSTESEDKDVNVYINSLLQQLAEKDAQLSRAKQKMLHCKHCTPSVSLLSVGEDGYERGDDHLKKMSTMTSSDALSVSRIKFGSISTYDDYLKSQRAKVRFHNSVLSSITQATNVSVRTAEERRVIRRIAKRRGAEWGHVLSCDFSEAEENEGNEILGRLWYDPPIQRQRWDEEQYLPHVNWGDLFFDLFYVGAAINLGILMRSTAHDLQQVLRGLIYFFGSLGPLWTTWEVQAFYESRYVTNDTFHQLVDVLRYLCVGFAIYNITPISSFSNPATGDVMEVTIAMLVELMISMGLCLELYYKGLGDKISIQNHTLDEFKFRNGAFFVLYLAAAVIATVHYVQAREDDSGEDLITVKNELLERNIWDKYDLPMTLTASAYFLRFVMMNVRYLLRDRKGDIQSWYIPTNVDYLIHRYGEFVMLMIGEGVVSLLIVDTVENDDYYATVICGLFTMIFIHVLKTESEPEDLSKHALWRSRLKAGWYSLFVQTLTIGLIGFGVCYNSFLHEIFDKATESAEIIDAQYEQNYYAVTYKGFSASLTIIVLSLELINLAHCGLKGATDHLFRSNNSGRKTLYWPVVIISLLKVGIILFCLTSFVWIANPKELSISGFGVVLALSITRVLNHIFIDKKEMVEKTTEHAANLARGVSQRLFPWSEESLEMDVEEGEDEDMESKKENLSSSAIQ